MKQLFGVITGDLIGFSAHSADMRSHILSELKNYLNSISKDKALVKQNFEIIRGDSFQGVIKDVSQTLRVALQIKCFLNTLNNFSAIHHPTHKTSDARMAIGIAEIDFFRKKISESDGEAFWISGRLLETMKKNNNGISIESRNKNFNLEMEVYCTLLDSIMTKWTFPQAELILEKLQNKKETEIAKKLAISQAAVNHRSQKSSWNAIEKLLARFEYIIENYNPA